MDKNKTCGDCQYFCQHYINRDLRGYYPICGHCLKRKIHSHILPEDKACQKFEEIDKAQLRKEKQKTSRVLIEKIDDTLAKLLEFMECD